VSAKQVIGPECSPDISPQDFLVLRSYNFTTSSFPATAKMFPLVVAQSKDESDA